MSRGANCHQNNVPVGTAFLNLKALLYPLRPLMPQIALQHRTYHAHFAEEAAEARQFCVTHLGSHCWRVVEPGSPSTPLSLANAQGQSWTIQVSNLGCPLISSWHRAHFPQVEGLPLFFVNLADKEEFFSGKLRDLLGVLQRRHPFPRWSQGAHGA